MFHTPWEDGSFCCSKVQNSNTPWVCGCGQLVVLSMHPNCPLDYNIEVSSTALVLKFHSMHGSRFVFAESCWVWIWLDWIDSLICTLVLFQVVLLPTRVRVHGYPLIFDGPRSACKMPRTWRLSVWYRWPPFASSVGAGRREKKNRVDV